ncbi:hypothetical protein [Janibacter anophelis]|uniref:hypothetical protein n=1 Tax=Janibacter anophelis TaxID=319054 RepID=UPI0012EE4227|nr:hypothetical protein [Janibacter anophelis]
MTTTSMTTSPSSTSSGPRTTSTTASPSSRIPAPEDLPASFGEWERLRATDSVAVYRNEEGDLIQAAAVHGSPDRTAAYEENVTIGDHVCGELQGTWQCLADLDGVTYVVAADEGYSASEVSDMLTELLTTIEEDAQ